MKRVGRILHRGFRHAWQSGCESFVMGMAADGFRDGPAGDDHELVAGQWELGYGDQGVTERDAVPEEDDAQSGVSGRAVQRRRLLPKVD